jgi:hypothetical protein
MTALVTDHHRQLFTTIEQFLATYYGFDPVVTVDNHIVSDDQLQELLPNPSNIPNFRAKLVMVEPRDPQGDLFVGIHFAKPILHKLGTHDPLVALCGHNLDAFCTVVEEISHLHTVANRAHTDRSVSRLELEFQGEIDKMLAAAAFLEAQAGDPHLGPLAQALFGDSEFSPDAIQVGQCYLDANKTAASFWYQFMNTLAHRDNPSVLNRDLRTRLRNLYRMNWSEKYSCIVNQKRAA